MPRFLLLCLLYLSASPPGLAAQAVLGQGIAASSNIALDTCVTGDMAYSNAGFQQVSMAIAGSEATQIKQLTAKLAAGIQTGLLGIGGDIERIATLTDTDQTLAVVITYHMTTKEVALYNVKPVAATAAGKLCGDHYVRSLLLGGRLYLAYVFHFHDQLEKQTFINHVTLSFLFGLFHKDHTWTSTEIQDFPAINVTLKAFQFGGERQALTDLMATFGPTVCTVANLTQCTQNFQSLISYAQGAFVNQLQAAIANQAWEQLDVTSVGIEDYAGLEISPGLPDGQVLSQMSARRLNLISQEQDNEAALSNAEALATSGAGTSDLTATQAQIQSCSNYAQSRICLGQAGQN